MPTLRLPLDAMEVVDMVVEVVVDTGARGLLMLKPAPTMADTMAVITGKGLLMPTLRLPLDAMEVVDMVVEVVVDTGARGLLMLKLAPTMADTMVVIGARGLPMPMPTLRLPLDVMEVVDMVVEVMVDTGARGLPMPTLRLPLDVMEVVDMVVVDVVDTGARGLLMLKPAPTKGMVYMAMDGASNFCRQ